MASTPVNGGQSALEIAAIAARTNNIVKNIFNNSEDANEYGATNIYALANTTLKQGSGVGIWGKGTGNFLDITNYAAGGFYDINGNQKGQNGLGSGRVPMLALNGSEWGFGPPQLGMQEYAAPDTSKNVGQVII